MKGFKERLAAAMHKMHISRYKLAKDCGISPSTISNWLTGATTPDSTKIGVVCRYMSINQEWLTTGKGDMSNDILPHIPSEDEIKEYDIERVSEISGDNDTSFISQILQIPETEVSDTLTKIAARNKKNWDLVGNIEKAFKELAEYKKKKQTRPRIPYTAAAGTLTSAVKGITADQCEQIPYIKIFPDYDFTIVLKGDSMEPKYEGGDEVACKRIDKTSFIQWGKPHVLDTAQGIIIKRIYENGDKIRCVSYNPEYPDFSIDKSEIYSISLVVGLVRL